MSLGLESIGASMLPSLAAPLEQSTTNEQNQLHLYGQTSLPNQLNQGYVVFEQQGDKVLGAFYSPRSEFHCFIGHLERKILSGILLASFQEDQHEVSISLESLYRLNKPSENDQRILGMCKKLINSKKNDSEVR